MRDMRVIARIPNIFALLFITFLYTFTYLGTAPIISVFVLRLLRRQGITAGTAVDFWVGAVTLAFTLAAAMAVPAWGRLLDRVGAGRVLAVGLGLGTLASLPTIVVQSPLQLAGARFVLGALAVGVGPSALALVRIYSPAGMESRVLAYAAAFGALGIGGGPFIAGQVGPLLGLRAFFALNSLLLAGGLALWLRALTRGAPADPVRGS